MPMNLPGVDRPVTTYADVLWHIMQRETASLETHSEPKAPGSLSSWRGLDRSHSGPHRLNSPSIIRSTDQSRLWALVIGINDYRDASMRKLKGAVRDAEAINTYLQSDLKVPRSQITSLLNENATRAEIIAAFKRLRDNRKIRRDDPILIYYAGLGGEIEGENIQAIIPVDYVPNTIHPIPDRTIAELINQIAERHGNNIVAVFDCCHLGSGTRGISMASRNEEQDDESIVRCGKLSPGDVPDDLDADLADTRTLQRVQGFAQADMYSHVLLAACSAHELAREARRGNESAGRFTDALLDLFKTVSPDQITYSEVLNRIRRIDGQNPQCEGQHKNRAIFDSKVRLPFRRCYEVNAEGRKHLMEGGRAHGITDGAEFTLYRNKNDVPEYPLGTMAARAEKIRAFETTLEPIGARPIPFENPAIAIQTKAGASEDLKLYVPLQNSYLPIYEAILKEISSEAGPRIILVDRSQADLEVVALGDSNFTLKILEKQANDYGFSLIPKTFASNIYDVRELLCCASHYFFHLNHGHPNNGIEDKIVIEFFRLRNSSCSGDYERDPTEENMHLPGMPIKIYMEEGRFVDYGMQIINNTPFDLYFSCFFFDYEDLSIVDFTEPNPHYRKNCQLRQGQTAEIGYGPLGIPPIRCTTPEGDVAIGYLKFYFMKNVVDLSHVSQRSPFSSRTTRRMYLANVVRDDIQVWGTVRIPVIQVKVRGS